MELFKVHSLYETPSEGTEGDSAVLYLATLSISKIIWMNRWVRSVYCSDTDTGIQNNSKQILTYCHFVHHKSHVNYLESKTSIPVEKPVNNQLSSGSYHSLQDQFGDRGSTVVKVLRYKSEGRWFGPSWCQCIFH